MTRTGIFGGTFNPVHTGHIALAQTLLKQEVVDELWLMVSPQNPFKVSWSLLDDEIRLRLARLAAKGIEGLKVSDYEFSLPKPSYMAHTLECLRGDYPDREFLLIIGADNWERFSLWHRHEEILAHHRIVVYPRHGSALDNLSPQVTVADTPYTDISSTYIRNSIGSPSYQGEGLPPAVWSEIKEKGYYTCGNEQFQNNHYNTTGQT